MMVKKDVDKKRLGRGLDAIFGNDVNALLDEIQDGNDGKRQVEINVNEIRANPYQPRKTFDDAALKELSASIKEHGIFTALIVRKSVQGYELIAGERRWRAAKMAGLKSVPCVVVDFSDEQMMEISILENIQRENLNAIEEALAYKNLIDKLGYTQQRLSERVNKTREYCANILRLLNLPHEVQNMIVKGKLSMSHARSLLGLNDEDLILLLANRIIKEKLSVREVERLVKNSTEIKNDKKPKEQDANLNYVRELIETKLQTNVKVDKKQIVIKFNDTKDLNRILDILGLIED